MSSSLSLPAGSVPGVASKKWWPLYDAVSVPTAGGKLSLFSVPRGQGTTVLWPAGGVKRICDTNMSQARQLPAGQQMFVKAMAFEICPSDAGANDIVSDMRKILRTAELRIEIAGDVKYYGRAGYIPAGSGITGFAATTAAATTRAHANNGVPQADNLYRFFDSPFVIASGADINVELEVGDSTLSAATPVLLTFWGDRYGAISG